MLATTVAADAETNERRKQMLNLVSGCIPTSPLSCIGRRGVSPAGEVIRSWHMPGLYLGGGKPYTGTPDLGWLCAASSGELFTRLCAHCKPVASCVYYSSSVPIAPDGAAVVMVFVYVGYNGVCVATDICVLYLFVFVGRGCSNIDHAKQNK